MNLIRLQRSAFSPWSGLRRLSNFHDDLESLVSSMAGNVPEAWVPAVDVYEEKDNYVVKVERPGVNKDEVKLSLEKGTLTIAGERKREATSENAELYHAERFQGRFQRTINLPESIAADKVTAQYKDGVLTVTLPKNEAAKPRQIEIVPS